MEVVEVSEPRGREGEDERGGGEGGDQRGGKEGESSFLRAEKPTKK